MLNTAVQLSRLHTTIIISLLFRNNFTKSSKKYNKLEQFDYGQLLSTSHHFHTCIGETYGDDWIYIGDVKKGTNDIPHGIGIKVWSTEKE